ncbi:MAG: FkbM family methyltransferase [Lentisphaerota bacterium]
MMDLYKIIKKTVFAKLPEPARHFLKKRMYPSWIQRKAEACWPLAATVRPLLKPGQTAVDVGANMGYVSYLLAKMVGPDGKVFSLEPIPSTYDLLQSNMRRLHLSQVIPMNYAASFESRDAEMEIPFFADGTPNYYEARLLPPGAPSELPSVNVCMRTLDDLLRDEPSVQFIKIDAEGHELDVLRGATEILRRDRPILVIEVWGDPDQPGTPAAGLFSLLAAEGYSAYLPREGKLLPRRKGDASVDYFFLQPGQGPDG